MPSISTQPNRAYPSIPEITEDSVSHTVALQAIKDALQTHERRDNNFLKSFIRFEELVDLGIIDVNGDFILGLANLNDTDLTDQAQGDLLYNADGTEWQDTGGLLTWDGSTLATTGVISLPAGTEGAPSLTFTGDVDTGVFSPGANIFAITVGGVEAIRYTGASAPLIRTGMTAGITASTTQTQGQQPLTSSWNEVSVVANNNDVVTMPSMFTGVQCVIINNGAKKLQVFPASGQDCGAGVNNSVTIKSNSSRYWFCYDSVTAFDIATDFKKLQNVEVGGAANNDLLYRSGGDWTHTGGSLTWDGSDLIATAIEGVYLRSDSVGTSALEDKTHAINTSAGKKRSARVWNNTTKKPVWANGPGDTAVWYDATGAIAHTPV